MLEATRTFGELAPGYVREVRLVQRHDGAAERWAVALSLS